MTAESQDVSRQIDLVLQKLAKQDAANIILEQFAAARVMVERELGSKLTDAEQWARKRRVDKS